MKFRYALAAVLGVVTPLSIMAGIQWYTAAALAGAANALTGYSHWDGAGTALLIVVVLLGINVAVLLLLGLNTSGSATPSAAKAPAAAPYTGTPDLAAPAASPQDPRPAVPVAHGEISALPGDTVESLTMRILEADRAAGAGANMARARRRAAELIAQPNREQLP